MELTCPTCQKPVRVPDDPAGQPGRRAKCIHCRASFEVPAKRAVSADDPTVVIPPVGPPPDLPPPPPPRATGKSPVLPRSVTGKHAALSRSSGSIPVPPRVTGSSRVLKPWGICGAHPGETATDFCENCNAGCCANCVRPMPGGKCCVTCQHPTMSIADKRRASEKDALRARPLTDEVVRVLKYPVSDPLGFVILVLLVGFFNAARGVGMGMQVSGFSYVFAQGLMMGYAFTALRRVSRGELTAGMPDMSSLDDLAQPVRLSAAAYFVSILPLMLVIAFTGFSLAEAFASARPRPHKPRVVHAKPAPSPAAIEDANDDRDPNQVLQELADQAMAAQAGAVPSDEEEEPESHDAASSPGMPIWAPFAITLSFLWALGYFPVAFMVAAISQSVWSTLDPREGLRAISAMGKIYWQAAGLSALLFVGCGIVKALAGRHPVTGFLVGPVVECYQWLAVGCLLGLAIFKRAEALGFD